MDSVEKVLRTALEKEPQDWRIRVELAEKIFVRGEAEEADEILGDATEPPDEDELIQRIGAIGGEKAVPLLEQIVARDSTHGIAHHALANALTRAGDEERAKRHHAVANALGAIDTAPELPESDEEISYEPEGEAYEEEEPYPEEEVSELALAPAPPRPFSTPPPPPSGVGIPAAPPYGSGTDGRPAGGSSKKATAIMLAVAVHLLIGIAAYFLVVFQPGREQPEIVAEVIAPPATVKQEMQKKTVMKQVKKSKSSSSASAPIARMMRANAVAKFAAPEVTKTSTGPLGLGEGDFGSGGFGSGEGLGSGASFFGGSATGNRFAFVLDYSGSMSDGQMNLVVKEMEKSLKALPPTVQYQVILFAGGATFAWPGWSIENDGQFAKIAVGPGNKRYRFYSPKKNAADFPFDGPDSRLPSEQWVSATKANIEKTMEILRKKKKWFGTDWRPAFKTAMNMTPPPDVIFFMADGTGGAHPPTVLSYNRSHGNAKINTFAMQTTTGAQAFDEIAKGAGGKFTIIGKNGKPIPGEQYFKNPNSVKKDL